MTGQQSDDVKNAVASAVQNDQGFVAKLLEEPAWQAIFASVATISTFGIVLGGIWMMDAIVN